MIKSPRVETWASMPFGFKDSAEVDFIFGFADLGDAAAPGRSQHIIYRNPKTNIEPENYPLEKETHLQYHDFWVPCVFEGCIIFCKMLKSSKIHCTWHRVTYRNLMKLL